MKRYVFCGWFILVGFVAVGQAQLATYHVQIIPNATALRVTDVYVETDGHGWLSGAFYCELDAGELVQDPELSQTDALEWLCLPGVNGIDSWVAPSISYFADADELALLPPFSGDASNAAASATFFPDLIDGIVPAWDGLAARFVYSADASGAWALRIGVTGNDPVIFAGMVLEGFMTLDSVTIAGDVNDDHLVNSDDLDVLRANWGAEGFIAGILGSGDANFDSLAGGDDLDIVRANWGNGPPDAVPEPSCWALVASLGLIVVGRRG